MPNPGISIDEFKSFFQSGGARSYMFYFLPTFPGAVAGSPNDVTYLVKSTTTPGYTIEEQETNWQGYIFKTAGKHTFDDFSVTFTVDGQAQIITLFQNWIKAAHDPMTNQHAENVNDYMATQELQLLGGNGNPIKVFRLYNAWVKTIGGLGLDYGNNDLIEIEVTFTYSHFDII